MILVWSARIVAALAIGYASYLAGRRAERRRAERELVGRLL